mmetsp:Transcript_24388/g.49738  ORF Transcript_24388/g.49738 Transcript_24388/m.49738 type:complete len:157 (-) Transcript_24388:709-1179(-)
MIYSLISETKSYSHRFLCSQYYDILEMGPLTMGYERWANLAPEVHELQSFGYAEVAQDGSELNVQLMNIDGSVMFSKTLKSAETPTSEEKDCQTTGKRKTDEIRVNEPNRIESNRISPLLWLRVVFLFRVSKPNTFARMMILPFFVVCSTNWPNLH